MSDPRLLEDLDRLMDLEQAMLADPYPLYARMRESAPVLHHRGLAHVTPYAVVDQGFRDTEHLSSRRDGSRMDYRAASLPDADDRRKLYEVAGFMSEWLVALDPPKHGRVRGLINRVFSPRRIADMEADIERITSELVGAAAAKGSMDVVGEVAFELPLYVIGAMVGVPREDSVRIREWSNQLGIFGANQANVREAHQAMLDFRGYVEAHLDSVSGSGSGGLLAALLEPDEAGDRLSRQDVAATLMVLLVGGHETTTNLIGNALYSLLRNPDQLALLRSNPDLIGGAVDESLRWETSNQNIHRTAAVTFSMAGVEIPAGTSVRLVIGAANRDPGRYEDPERFDITRTGPKSLAFGMGPHYCLGASLATAELRIAVGHIVELFPRLRLAETPRWRANQGLRGLESLTVSV